jgi:hypothetical protein
MQAFVMTSVILALMGLGLRIGHMSRDAYPRTDTVSKGTDAFMVLLTIGWCWWGIWLLTR